LPPSGGKICCQSAQTSTLEQYHSKKTRTMMSLHQQCGKPTTLSTSKLLALGSQASDSANFLGDARMAGSVEHTASAPQKGRVLSWVKS